MDRKYSQRGYMESSRDDRTSRPKRGPRDNLTNEERIQRRSMRHAIDRDAREVLRCHTCGTAIADIGTIGFDTNCGKCQTALRCCRNCRHFDSSARWQCRAEVQEAVGDKLAANRCDQWDPLRVLDSTGRRTTRPGSNSSSDPRSQFDNLFKR